MEGSPNVGFGSNLVTAAFGGSDALDWLGHPSATAQIARHFQSFAIRGLVGRR